MRLAILGATSQIAKDLVLSFGAQSSHDVVLYARRPQVVAQWLARVGLADTYAAADFSAFNVDAHFDTLLNFVGVGDPVQAVVMGASIFDVTLQYDELALNYLRHHPDCRYIFLSSGAAYGSRFDAPVDANTPAEFTFNHLRPQDWYGVAKLHAECRHRSLPHLAITDIRVFNYFSHTQDMTARFLMTDILRAINHQTVLKTSADYIVRDYLHPSDFYQLVTALLTAPATNTAVDCYSRAPVDKATLLTSMQENFGLTYEVVSAPASVNATGSKPCYYSLNKRAADFGYRPRLTSLGGVLQETEKALSSLCDA